MLCHPGGLTGFGQMNYVALVGIAPGREEVNRGVPFVGPSGKLLKACLQAQGYNTNKFWYTNLYCGSIDILDSSECKQRLLQELAEVKPRVIITLGKEPSEALTGLPFGKTRAAALWNKELRCWVISSFNPAAALKDGIEAIVIDNLRDFKKIPLYLGTTPRDFEVNYVVINNLDLAKRCLAALPRDKAVALDVETDIEKDIVVCLAISDGSKTFVLPRDVLLGLESCDFPNDIHWAYHYSFFDVSQVKKNFGVELQIKEDTLIQSYTLDSRGGGDAQTTKFTEGLHGLKRLAAEYCGAGIYNIDTQKTIQAGDTDALYKYNAKDAAYTARLSHLFKEWQEQEKVRDFYKSMYLDLIPVFMDCQENGVPIDKDALARASIRWDRKIDAMKQQLQYMAKEMGWSDTNFNPSSPIQLQKLLFDIAKFPLTSRGRTTAKDVITEIDHPFIDLLLKYRRSEKMMGTYMDGVHKSMDSSNRIHPTPLLHGTVTGRLTYKNPPIQTIPRSYVVGEEFSKIREMFAPPPDSGQKVFSADYAQAELWMMAICSGDEQMLHDLKQGDFHGVVTEEIFKVKKGEISDERWKFLRFNSKFVTFGVAYDRSAYGLHAGEMKDYSLEECQGFIDRWYEKYHVYRNWSIKQQEIARETGEQFIISGRKYRFPIELTQNSLRPAMNYPIQGGAHDFLLESIKEIHPILKSLGAHIWFEIHDSIVGEYPESKESEVINALQTIMTKPRFNSPYGLPVEISIGPNWNQVKEIV